MSTKKYLSYEEAAADYLAKLNDLLQVPAEVKGIGHTRCRRSTVPGTDRAG
jgi:hypothetical protein